MKKDIITELRTRSLAGTITFPEVLQKCIDAGVERYRVDFIGLKASYYSTGNDAYIAEFEFESLPVAQEFKQSEIKEALLDVREDRMQYAELLRRIIGAGCCSYEVFVTGKKAIYFGRDGSYHVEIFPTGK